MTRRFYKNGDGGTTLATGINASVTSITVANAGSFPTSTPFAVVVEKGTANAEIVLVTGVTGNVLTVTRGYNSTTAVSHGTGVAIVSGAIALDFDDAAAHVAATSGAHGVVGTLVGTTDSQTLTNKTLTSPTISGPTVTGTLAGANETLSGTLAVTGASTLTGAVTAAAAGTGLAVTNNATVGGTMAVTGAHTAASYSANGNGTVTGVISPKSYTNEAAAGTVAAGAIVYLTAPTAAGATAGVFMSQGGGNWIKLDREGSFMQAEQTTLQAITAATATTLTNYTADFADAAFNTTTGVYTCPAAGVYEAWGVVSLAAGSARNAVLLAKNGTIVIQSDTGAGSSVVSPSLPPFRMTCALNDTIALQAYVATGVNTNVGSGSPSFFCVKRVS